MDLTLIQYNDFHKVADKFLIELDNKRVENKFGEHFESVFKRIGFDSISYSDQQLALEMMVSHNLIKVSTARMHGESKGYYQITITGHLFASNKGYSDFFEKMHSEEHKSKFEKAANKLAVYLQIIGNSASILGNNI